MFYKQIPTATRKRSTRVRERLPNHSGNDPSNVIKFLKILQRGTLRGAVTELQTLHDSTRHGFMVATLRLFQQSNSLGICNTQVGTQKTQHLDKFLVFFLQQQIEQEIEPTTFQWIRGRSLKARKIERENEQNEITFCRQSFEACAHNLTMSMRIFNIMLKKWKRLACKNSKFVCYCQQIQKFKILF